MISSAVLCLVVAISDGDTLKVRCGEPGAYEQVTIRLAEIDAPEKAQPFGQQSKQALSDLCFQTWATVKPQTRDRYGRTVARVECNGKDASSEQASAGLAWFFTRYGRDASVKAAEGLARGSRAGLWVDPSPVPPWEWRHARTRAMP
jgi:micrococcal nuclease